MKYDIFISYKRRGSSSATAAYVYDLLTKYGYNVFFDRKEIRQGKFNEQLFQHISEATDVIILLEDGSLTACFNGLEDSYKTDWFCMEIMHALKEQKRIIPLLLEGYRMPDCSTLPDELKGLAMQNAISLDISEIEEFYNKYLIGQGYLASKPKNLFISQHNGQGISDFLFYSNEDCDVFEFGNLVGRLNVNNDEDHPYKYAVTRSGEHRFVIKNNNTSEEQRFIVEIEPNAQKYIQLNWKLTQNLWLLTVMKIEEEKDPQNLFFWGKGLYEGTGTHDPNIYLSFQCLVRAEGMGFTPAIEFLKDKVGQISGSDIDIELRYNWCLKAAELGLDMAQYKVSKMLLMDNFPAKDENAAFDWNMKAAQQNYLPAIINAVLLYERGQGVEKNYQEAFYWAEKAAATGEPRGFVCLGRLFFRGLSVQQDYSKAYDLFLKAAEQKDYDAYQMLGIMNYGYGKKRNLDEAIKWLTLAAESNKASCMNNLAFMLIDKGEYEDALKWAMKSNEVDPNICTTTDTLGSIYYRLGRYEESLEQYNKTVELMNRETAVFYFQNEEQYESFKKATYAKVEEITQKLKADPS